MSSETPLVSKVEQLRRMQQSEDAKAMRQAKSVMELLNGIRDSLTILSNQSSQQAEDDKIAEMHGALMRLETQVSEANDGVHPRKIYGLMHKRLGNMESNILKMGRKSRMLLILVILATAVLSSLITVCLTSMEVLRILGRMFASFHWTCP